MTIGMFYIVDAEREVDDIVDVWCEKYSGVRTDLRNEMERVVRSFDLTPQSPALGELWGKKASASNFQASHAWATLQSLMRKR